MKKLLCGLLMVLLLIALAGCGGGGSSPVGKTMTNDEVNAKYFLGLEGMEAFNMGMDYIDIPESMSTAGFKAENSLFNWSGFSNGFKAFAYYTWTSTGSGGWYTRQETDEDGITYTYWIRYLEASNTIELKDLYTEDGETFSSIVSLTQSSGNKWSGSASATITSPGIKIVLDVTFANVDGAAYGSGSYKVWVKVNSDYGSIPKTLFADYTVSYDATKDPTPIKVTGWYGFEDDRYTFPDEWVSIPDEYKEF